MLLATQLGLLVRLAGVVELLEHVGERDDSVGLLSDAGDPGAAGEVVDTVGEQDLGAGDVAPVDDVDLCTAAIVGGAGRGGGWGTHLGHDKSGHVAGTGLLVAECVDGVEKTVEETDENVVEKLVGTVAVEVVLVGCELSIKFLEELGVGYLDDVPRKVEHTFPGPVDLVVEFAKRGIVVVVLCLEKKNNYYYYMV